MQCPRCGKAIANGAAFCPHCGQFLAAPAYGGVALAVPSAKKNTTAWAIAGTLLAVLILFFGLKAAGILQFGTKVAGDSLANKGQPAPDSLAQRAAPDPAALEQQGTKGPGMPDDVRKYLEHVERIEKKKNELAARMIAEMQVFKDKLGTFGGAEGLMNHDEDLGGDGQKPDKETKDTFGDVKSRWEDLVNEFKSVPPPKPCVDLRDDYYRALSAIPGFAGDLSDVLNDLGTDPAGALQKVKGMQDTSSNSIDRYFGQSDTDVSTICNEYSTQKWFTISKDVGGGGLSMGGGL
jgi:hypothetical protein